MHPRIRQPAPGNCSAWHSSQSLEDEENPAYIDFRRRFWWTLPLTIVVTALAVNRSWSVVDLTTQPFVEMVLAAPVVWWAGWPFFVRWWQSLVQHVDADRYRHRRRLSLHRLCSARAGSVAPILPQRSRHRRLLRGGSRHRAAHAAWLLLELRARSQTSVAIKALLGMAPKTARRLKDDGTDEDIPLTHVHVGDRLRVRPGEKVPVDGVVLEGGTGIDDSMLTANRSRSRKRSTTA